MRNKTNTEHATSWLKSFLIHLIFRTTPRCVFWFCVINVVGCIYVAATSNIIPKYYLKTDYLIQDVFVYSMIVAAIASAAMYASEKHFRFTERACPDRDTYR